MKTALEVGQTLVALCKEGKFEEAIESLYAANVVSIEPKGNEKMPARMQGIEAVRAKTKWWNENHTVHGCVVEGPYPHGDRFIVHFKIDVTPKSPLPMAGKRITLDETGLYAVKDGKVAQEEFFYHMG
jgi:SnoaL-like domain